MHLVDLLSMSFMAIGLVVGTALGVLAAVGLHWLLPGYELRAVQACLVGSGLLLGAFLGSRFDLDKK
jgi:TctA family transporter